MDKEMILKETKVILDKLNAADEVDRADVKAGVKLLACALTGLDEHALIEAVYGKHVPWDEYVDSTMLPIDKIAPAKDSHARKLTDEKKKVIDAMMRAYDDGVFEESQDLPDIIKRYL